MPPNALGCYWASVDLAYYTLWPWVAYLALRIDSSYWRNVGVTWLNSSGSSASHSLLQQRTQDSAAMLFPTPS